MIAGVLSENRNQFTVLVNKYESILESHVVAGVELDLHFLTRRKVVSTQASSFNF